MKALGIYIQQDKKKEKKKEQSKIHTQILLAVSHHHFSGEDFLAILMRIERL